MHKFNEISEDRVKCIPIKFPKEAVKALQVATGKDTEFAGMISPYIRACVLKQLVREGYLQVRERPISIQELEQRERSAQVITPRPGSKFRLKFLNPFFRRKIQHIDGQKYFTN